jgi:hypothetical protein
VPIPAGVETVTVTDGGVPLTGPDGTPLEGSFTVAGPDLATVAEDDYLFGGSARRWVRAGRFDPLPLVATDATGIDPTGFSYTIVFTPQYGTAWTRYFQLPKASPSVVLADILIPDPVAGSHAVLVDPATLTVTQDQVTDLPEALDALLPRAGGSVTGDLDVAGRLSTAGLALPLRIPSSPRPAYRDPSWSQQFQAGHGWSTSGSGVASSNLNDTSLFSKGTQSARFTTTGTGSVANLRRLGSALPDLTGKALRFLFRIDDTARLNQINVQVGTGNLVNYFQWRLVTRSATAENQVLSGEWVTAVLSWADVRSAAGSYSLSSTGVPSATSGFTDLMFQVVDNAGGPLTVHLQAVEVIPDTSETFPSGVVSVTFDDSYASQVANAGPILNSLSFRPTLYTICDVIGTSGYLTLGQLRTAQAVSEWEIAGHAYSVANHNSKFHTLTTTQVDNDIRRCRMWMLGQGFLSDSFAYPGGFFSRTSDGTSIESLACLYFGSGRGISSADTLEPFPPPMPMRMRSISGIGSMAGAAARGYPANLTGPGGALDRCLQGEWVILTFHDIVTGSAANANQCSLSDFTAIMNAIRDRNIPVRPVGDVLRHYS